jgi:hypothetical protein
MHDEEARLRLARLRTRLREIDSEIARIEAEDRLFRRFHFGSDVHEIQLNALRNEREDCRAEIARWRHRTRPNRRATGGWWSWLLLPAALGAALFPSRRPRRPPRLA